MRTYSEQEVADIIARAAERQAASTRAPTREGLTLDEIERLGSEAGLDPDDLRAAAAEVDAGGRTLARQSSQTRTHVVVERWIDAPLTEAGWVDAVAEMQDAFGADLGAAMGMSAGGQQQIGRAFEWTHTSGLGVHTKVVASPRGERTKLRLTQLVGMASPRAEGLGYGAVVGVLAAVGALVAVGQTDASFLTAMLVLVATFAVVTAIAAPVTTALDRRWRSKKLDALGALADRIAPVLAAPTSDPLGNAPPQAVPPQAVPLRDAPLRDAFDALGDTFDDEGDGEAPDRARDRA